MPFSDAYHLVSNEFFSNITVFTPSLKTILVFLNWKLLLLEDSLHFHKLMLPRVLDKILLRVEKLTKKTNNIIPFTFNQGNAIELLLSNMRLYLNKRQYQKGKVVFHVKLKFHSQKTLPDLGKCLHIKDWIESCILFINHIALVWRTGDKENKEMDIILSNVSEYSEFDKNTAIQLYKVNIFFLLDL